MKKFLRFCLWSLLGVVGLGAVLFGYFIYSPAPTPFQHSGQFAKASIEVAGTTRTYMTYVPSRLPKGSPLLLVMHGSGENAAQIRVDTGYGFERVADQRGFAVVYPNARSFDWNDCSKVGDFSIDGREADDVGFLVALIDKLAREMYVDRHRVYATGVSSGGGMAIRLAIETPSKFRAIAAVSANVPVQENFKCNPAPSGISILIMNGTKDTLVPFEGGESSLLGLFYKGGNLLSTRESGEYFADRNKISGPPTINRTTLADDLIVERSLWHDDSKSEVEVVAIHGGGHGMPQPYWRRPRLLGPSPMEPDGPAIIWSFFERQR
jgi:polyhydroxybutyrate depolymerase